MLNISYNLSPKLKDYLKRIENLRRFMLLNPLSPKEKLILRWYAVTDRIYFLTRFSNKEITKEQIIKLLAENNPKTTEKNYIDTLGYKKALSHIFQTWLGSDRPIGSDSIIEIYEMIANGKL